MNPMRRDQNKLKINMKCTATNHEKIELNSNDEKQTQ